MSNGLLAALILLSIASRTEPRRDKRSRREAKKTFVPCSGWLVAHHCMLSTTDGIPQPSPARINPTPPGFGKRSITGLAWHGSELLEILPWMDPLQVDSQTKNNDDDDDDDEERERSANRIELGLK